MVLHTDKEIQHWARYHNGWGDNTTLTTF
jgi:hypothetical protein